MKKLRSTMMLTLLLFFNGCQKPVDQTQPAQQGSRNSATSVLPASDPQTGITPLEYGTEELPTFVELPEFQQIEEGVLFADLWLTKDRVSVGKACRLFVLMPEGDHQPASLPTYFLAAAGATSTTGRILGEGDLAELIPWAEAGFIAIGYELDGQLEGNSDELHRRASLDHEASHGGLVNARNAIEFALARIPEVDPKRLYTGGHSSAGRQSLLFAAFDSRIKAAISFNGVFDKVRRLTEDGTSLNQYADYVARIAQRTNPAKYATQIDCPLFFFHSEQDTVVSPRQSKEAAKWFRRQGNDVTLELAEGSHYQPMVDVGIPLAIKWLQKIDAKALSTD